MPFAPWANTLGTSSGNSILAASSISFPSSVFAGKFFNLRRCFSNFSNRFFLARYFFCVSFDGFIITRPRLPSTITLEPSLTLEVAVSRPTTAGISKDFAIIAVCEVRPPISVAKAITLPLCIMAVSEGERS